MGQRLKSACTHIEVSTAWGLVITPGVEVLLPLPSDQIVLASRR
jgi:hypothetical protein